MENLVVFEEKPKIPEEWDYEKSVSKVKQQIYKWKNLSIEIIRELWIAHTILTSQVIGRGFKGKTWANFCKEIGIDKSTAYRWFVNSGLIEKKGVANALPLPPGKFNVIYADPPWRFSNVGLGGSAEKHYRTLLVGEIIDYKDENVRQITDLVDDNAVLFLWVPNSFLEEGFEVCEGWGFEYKTNFIWLKQKPTYGKLGFYNYGQHEFLFVGVKGSFLPREGELIPSIIVADKTNVHSQKPEVVYEIIQKMYPPPCRYVEGFAREKRQGWEAWGDELISG